MSLAPATRLGPYEIVTPLGAGGMGEVYLARDTRLGREVALKVLPREKLTSPENRLRFAQEAKTASSLNHPNIVTIFDIGSEGGLEYIAMEYVKGQTLDQLVPAAGFRLREALKYAIPVADALACAHAAGIVHRDLKPGNVMVTAEHQVKLLDFGLAKLTGFDGGDSNITQTAIASPRTMQGTILGTVAYMSPEQAEGKTVDARSDIFSFGTVLYEMLTGRRAFQNDSTISTLSAILRDNPKPIGVILDDTRGEVDRVIARCLRKDPEKRWQTMRDVKVALEHLKEESDSGTVAFEPGALSRSPRRSGVLTLVAVVVTLLAAAIVGGWWLATRRTPDTVKTVMPAKAVLENSALTNDQVVDMVKSGLSPSLVASQIRSSKTNFDLSTRELIRLSKAGVPSEIIEAMRNPAAIPGRAAAAQPLPGAPAPPAVPVPPAAPPAAGVELKDGTPVRLVLMQDISPETQPGDLIAFTVAADVMSGDAIAIAKGASASGEIVKAEKKKLFGRGGKLIVRFGSVRAIDGQKVRIRTTESGLSDDQIVSKIKSKDVLAAKGTEYPAFVAENKMLAPRAGHAR